MRGNCPSGAPVALASCRLPRGGWRLAGAIEPRFMWTAQDSRKRVREAGLRLEF